MYQNYNAKNPGETNKNLVAGDHLATAPEKNIFTPGNTNDPSNFSRTSRSSTIHSKSSTSVTPYKGYPGNNIVTMTSSPLQKYPIYTKKGD